MFQTNARAVEAGNYLPARPGLGRRIVRVCPGAPLLDRVDELVDPLGLEVSAGGQ